MNKSHKKYTRTLGQVQWMFIEDQQLYNSVDSLSEKSYLLKCVIKCLPSKPYACDKQENCWGMLAEGKTETKIQHQSSPQIVHTQYSNKHNVYILNAILLSNHKID